MIFRNENPKTLLNRRSFLLGAAQIAGLSLLSGRLYYLQILEREKYHLLAEDNRLSVRLLAPERGKILDRQGLTVAASKANFRLMIVPEQVGKNIVEPLQKISKIINLSPDSLEKLLKEIKKKPRFLPTVIQEGLLWKDVAKIEMSLLDYPGFFIEEVQQRYYPFKEFGAHILGYVSAPTEKDEEKKGAYLSAAGIKVGKNGLEKLHDNKLRGLVGSRQVEINARGRLIREISRQVPKKGKDLNLTIDFELQKHAVSLLSKHESAGAVVMNIHTGEVLCMASHPAFDGNLFTNGISHQDWKGLLSDPYNPLTNKVIQGQYAPGSAYKLVVALAALENNIVDVNTNFYCPGHVSLGGRRFHCWKRGGHGKVDFLEAIYRSCDVYFYELGKRLDIDAIASVARRLGFGALSNIGLPDEKPGLVPTRAWKKAALKESWYPGESLVASIGQGYVLATPLQPVVMLARISNGGFAVEPHLIRGEAEPAYKQLSFSQANLDLIVKGLEMVSNVPRGTGYRTRITEKGLEMGGKSGTTQVKRITMAERRAGVRKNADLPWKFRDHGLFIGFAPIKSPRYAAVVIVEHGGFGSTVAGPIVRDLLLMAQKRKL